MSSKDTATTTTTTTKTGTAKAFESEQKKSFDSLVSKLQSRGISLVEFAHVKENRRKKMLDDDYQNIKNDAQWIYDEPIEYPPEVVAKEKELEKAKLEAISRVK